MVLVNFSCARHAPLIRCSHGIWDTNIVANGVAANNVVNHFHHRSCVYATTVGGDGCCADCPASEYDSSPDHIWDCVEQLLFDLVMDSKVPRQYKSLSIFRNDLSPRVDPNLLYGPDSF